MFDSTAPKPKATRNRNRFKHLDAWIRRTMDYAQRQGIVIGTEREAYACFKRVQEMENGYATPPQEMAQISAERVKEEFGFHLFQSRWRQAEITFRRPDGKVISIRRYLPLGLLGWRDTGATAAAAQTEEDQYLIATGFTAAAEQYKLYAQQCSTYLTQAELLTEMAAQPQLLFPPEGGEVTDSVEGTDDDGDAE